MRVEDPRFVSTMSAGPRGGKRMVIGVLGVAVGLALIVLAVAQRMPVVAVPGFLIMLAGASFGLSRAKQPTATAASTSRGAASDPSLTQGGLFNRLEERWDRRRDEQQ